MSARIKPFPYDAVETPSAIVIVFPSQGGDGRPANTLLAPNGLQITRADGMVVRLGNLHPRLREVIGLKPLYVCEQSDAGSVLYSTDSHPPAMAALGCHLGKAFYWYIGPETSTLREVADRPLARLLATAHLDPVAVAPGEAISGPLIGLCTSSKCFIPLARGRHWAQARRGLIVDMGFATGAVAGYPANDDIVASVASAHDESRMIPVAQKRRSWNSQIACAFPANQAESLAQG